MIVVVVCFVGCEERFPSRYIYNTLFRIPCVEVCDSLIIGLSAD